MSRRLDDLSREFLPLAVELLARLVEAQIPVMVIDTLRTKEEQAENVRKGVSATLNSKHLTGDAIDICPYAVYEIAGPDKLQWNTKDPVWLQIGEIGERLGLRWGGRWKVPHDPGHFELVRPAVKFANHSDVGSDIPSGGAS
jgi:peptidoglycan L-alanyl-D-glutamate endopeptidase CwlK